MWQIQLHICVQITGSNNSEKIIKIELRLTKLCLKQRRYSFLLTVYIRIYNFEHFITFVPYLALDFYSYNYKQRYGRSLHNNLPLNANI